MQPMHSTFEFDKKGQSPQDVLRTLAGCVKTVYADQIFGYSGSVVEIDQGRIRPISVARMAGILPRAVYFVVESKEDGKRQLPVSRDWAERLVHVPELFDPLRGIRSTPFFRPDGTLVLNHGYDPVTGVYLDWVGPPPDPAAITDDDIARAKDMLLSFSFATPGDQLAALAFFVQPLLQIAYRGAAPEYMAHSPAKAAGKSWLVDAWGILHLGHPPSSVPAGASPSEGMYQLHGELAKGRMIIYSDNHPSGAVVGGAERNRLLTAPGLVSVRPVKQSTVQVEPRLFTWVTTINRYDIDDEHARRTLPIGLVPPTAPFKYPDLQVQLQNHRAWFVACLIALVQRWQAAGCPKPPRTLPSFQGWSDYVGGVACFALPEAAASWLAEETRPMPAADREWARLFEGWPRGPEGALELRPTAILTMVEDSDHSALRELVGSGSPASRLNKLGRALNELAESRRRCGGWRLGRKSSGNNKTFRPVKADG